MTIRSISLVQRIFLASLLLLPALLGFSALMLNRAFVNSLITAEQEALLAQTYTLIGAAEPVSINERAHKEKYSLSLPQALLNPRFETPASGLYAQVINDNDDVIWRSNSWIGSDLQTGKYSQPKAGEYIATDVDIQGQPFTVFRFGTVWEMGGQDQSFNFMIFLSRVPREKEVKTYQTMLWLWLGGMAILLITIQIFIVRWGLKPLNILAGEIRTIEEGSSKAIKQTYPKDLQPVSDNLNALLKSEEIQRERYKNTLADLAHSLKTPLAVIRAQLDSPTNTSKELSPTKLSWREEINEQIERMSHIIAHQLHRASAQTHSIYQSQTAIKPLVNRIGAALQKVYKNKHIDLINLIPDDLHYAIAEDDAMEVLGNLLENAFKYGHNWVQISTTIQTDTIEIHIEDDGKGVSDNTLADILKRGARADTKTSGQGIGLTVATDILSSYNAGLNVSRSSKNGACFTIELTKI